MYKYETIFVITLETVYFGFNLNKFAIGIQNVLKINILNKNQNLNFKASHKKETRRDFSSYVHLVTCYSKFFIIIITK